MDYVSTVYRDYRIRNRFGDLDLAALKKNAPHIQQMRVERSERAGGRQEREAVRMQTEVVRQERPTSVQRPSKQFLNVTQESKISRRDISFSSHKK
jgi:hypothetical protein